MCKFCSGEASFMTLRIENIFMKEEANFFILNDYIYLCDKDENIHRNLNWKIYYCPICGRKLVK